MGSPPSGAPGAKGGALYGNPGAVPSRYPGPTMASPRTAPRKDPPAGLDGVVGHDAARDWLRRGLAGDRLPHALLVVGPRGVGKRTLARALAQEFFCRERRGRRIDEGTSIDGTGKKPRRGDA